MLIFFKQKNQSTSNFMHALLSTLFPSASVFASRLKHTSLADVLHVYCPCSPWISILKCSPHLIADPLIYLHAPCLRRHTGEQEGIYPKGGMCKWLQ